MNRRSLILAAGALSSLGVLRVFAVEPGIRAPDFEAVDTANKKRRLAEFKGKTVVLEWTSPSCPFVRAQYGGAMQEVQAWATKQGVVWLSILSTHPSRRDWLPPDKAEAMSRGRGAAPSALLLDPEGAMGRAGGPCGPTPDRCPEQPALWLHHRLQRVMRYLEDFSAGQKFGSGRLKVEEARIKSFAEEFDPQPFHLDEAAARGSIFASRCRSRSVT